MRIEYFPETDTLSILFMPQGHAAPDGRDSSDPDVTFFYDDRERLGEILIEGASRRIDLDEMRRRVSFEIIPDAERVAA